MIPESILSVWACMYSWFTPTLLFLLLNLVIGTIAITSGLGSRKRSNNDDGTQPHQQLDRAPSVLERLKSLNLHRYRSQDLNPFSSIATAFLHVQPPELGDAQETQVVPANEQQQQQEVRRPKKMMKSAVSATSDDGSGGFEESKEMIGRRRPETVKVGKNGDEDQLRRFGGDEEVDAKADDFINRFKQQLKLQRLDSIMRYKEMLSGSER